MRRSTNAASHLSYQRLETRSLLAGNILVSLESNTLVVAGDELANQVDVAQNTNGDVVFTGRDSTTINGLTEFTFTGVFGSSRFELNGGADEVVIDGFEGGHEFRFLGGDGNDSFDATAVTSRNFHVQGNAGDDVIQLTDSSSRRSAYFHLNDGDDVIGVESFDAGRNFKVFGDDGDDTFASAELTAGRKLRINLGNGSDQALISGETSVGRSTKVRLGSGDDFLGVLPELTDGTANFDGFTKFRGQSGSDSIELGDDVDARVRQFENQDGNLNALLDQVFTQLDFAGIDSSLFGNDPVTDQDSSIEIDLPQTAIEFEENGEALEIADDFELTADASENIVSATVEVQGGDSSDLLSFVAQNGIFGNFESDDGILTLTGTATASQYENAIQSILFEATGDDPVDGIRTLVISIQSQLPVDSISASRVFLVTAVDDSLNLILPGAFGDDDLALQEIGQQIAFTVESADPDSPVVFELDLEDSGIPASVAQPTIDSETGEFVWTPTETGTFLIRVIATNDLGESDQEEFSVTVTDEVLATLTVDEIDDQTVSFNESFEIPVQATSVGTNSPVSFEIEVTGDAIDGTSNVPVISDSGVITWTPDLLTSGTATITVTATDGNQLTDTETFEISLPGFQPFQGNGQLASVAPADRDGIYGDSFQGSGPPVTIDQSLDYTATITTGVGEFVVNLFQDLTPLSVNNFVNLAQDGFYDGLSFHRVVESPVVDGNGLPVLDDDGNIQFERFVAQGGDPTDTSTGGPGYRINDEILPELTFDRPGVLAYARTSDPNTNGSQFFITYDATSFQNDENFTIFGEVDDFGEVINGLNVLERLNLTDPTDFNPATPTIIESITIEAV